MARSIQTFGNSGVVTGVEDFYSNFFHSVFPFAWDRNGNYIVANNSINGTVGIARYLAGIVAPTSFSDEYVLPANWAVYANDVMGTKNSAKADDGILANDQFDHTAKVKLEVVREAGHGKLQFAQDGSFSYIPDENVSADTEDSFVYRLRNAYGQLSGESKVTFRFSDKVDPPRHNKRSPHDVNQDGEIAPIDVLNIINVMARNGSAFDTRSGATDSTMMCDVNGDMYVSPIDALLVINALKRRSSTSSSIPEGESIADKVFASNVDLDDVLSKRKKQDQARQIR